MADEPIESLAERLQGVCLGRGFTICTAESCTGGLVVAALTEVAGSSGYVLGGVVAYANDAKTELLGVSPPVIAAHGAVSAQVAQAMADGARARFGATFAVAITGLAGPGGGSEAKPVGLTYLGLAGPTGTAIRRHVWSGDRAAIRTAGARAALAWLLEETAR